MYVIKLYEFYNFGEVLLAWIIKDAIMCQIPWDHVECKPIVACDILTLYKDLGKHIALEI